MMIQPSQHTLTTPYRCHETARQHSPALPVRALLRYCSESLMSLSAWQLDPSASLEDMPSHIVQSGSQQARARAGSREVVRQLLRSLSTAQSQVFARDKREAPRLSGVCALGITMPGQQVPMAVRTVHDILCKVLVGQETNAREQDHVVQPLLSPLFKCIQCRVRLRTKAAATNGTFPSQRSSTYYSYISRTPSDIPIIRRWRADFWWFSGSEFDDRVAASAALDLTAAEIDSWHRIVAPAATRRLWDLGRCRVV